MFEYLQNLYKSEPVRFVTSIVSLVLVIAKAAGVALEGAPVYEVVAIVALILFGGETVRSKVVPYVPDPAPVDGDDRKVA